MALNKVDPSLLRPQADTSTWDFHYKNLLDSIPGNNDEQKQATIRKRILKYFGGFKFEEETYFCPRLDVDFNGHYTRLIPNTLLLYGTDYLTQKACTQYFVGFATLVRRVDDSHMIVEFKDNSECLAAINKHNL